MTRLLGISGALAALITLTTASGASAQLAAGRSGQSTTSYVDGEAAMAELMNFGRCYAQKQTEKALRLLRTEPTSIEERRTFIALFKNSTVGCLTGVSSMSADVPFVRGAIAEGFYVRGIALPADMMKSVPTAAEVTDLSGAARCYVAAHPETARTLLATTKAGSRKEFDAINGVMDDFFQCVPEGAREIRLDATVIRLRMAEALLRTTGPLEKAD